MAGTTCRYPKPDGLENHRASGMSTGTPPTGPPQYPTACSQQRAIGMRPTKKTNASEADKPASANMIKDNILDLRLRFQQTGSTTRPRLTKKRPSGTTIEEISLSQAIGDCIQPTKELQQEIVSPYAVRERQTHERAIPSCAIQGPPQGNQALRVAPSRPIQRSTDRAIGPKTGAED